MTKSKDKNPVCAVWWNDAAYSFQNDLPNSSPRPILTVGFVIESNDDFLNIATDVEYKEESDELVPSRGVLIPDESIIKFKKIGFLHE